MKQSSENFPSLIQKFFLQWLMAQRNVSPETIKSYRDTFRIFIQYMDEEHKIKPSAMTINCLEAEHILGFLANLEIKRGNKAKTINLRHSALNSFLKYLSFKVPEYSGLLNRSLMVPYRKEEKRSMDFLTKDEYNALLNACDLDSELGSRDYLMVTLLYNTGVRVSELLGIKVKHVVNDAKGLPSYIHIYGKGRKERDAPLWRSTAEFLFKFVEQKNMDSNDKLFLNRTDVELTRSGIRYSLNCLVKTASESTPSMNHKVISAHTFRHTVALNLLQSGVDISTIAIWLGHESILTTHKYMEADMEMKRRTLEKIQEPGSKQFSFCPDDAVLAFLDSL